MPSPSLSIPPTPKLRKTRIVCISDTHCQTPKLPRGDVLIHAGDLTKQGSLSEMSKTVAWLERAEFECKVVVGGNHDITLDEPFFQQHASQWKWPQPQSPSACRQLLTSSPSITYLEHEAATIYLTSPDGPHTCFNIFGSPYSPKSPPHDWAFQYEAGPDAARLWDAIPDDADIVVTHTPPKGHCDQATKDDRTGCEALLRALRRVRPMLSVCGHIHEARGVERMRWNVREDGGELLTEAEKWNDPGVGNHKQSLVNLTAAAGGRGLDNESRLTRQAVLLQDGGHVVLQDHHIGGQPDEIQKIQPMVIKSDLGPACTGGVLSEAEEETAHGQMQDDSSVGLTTGPEKADNVEAHERRETVVINAAVLGPRIPGKAMQFNKPIVIDVALPVWSFDKDAR